MPWCPICKNEYREGFSVCTDCGGPLSEQEPLEPLLEPQEDLTWSVFFQTNNEIEAEIIESLLKEEKIPFIRKDRGAGGYLKVYMGMTSMGLDIYVPDARLEEARQLLPPQEAIYESEEEQKLVQTSNRRNDTYEVKKKHRGQMVIFYWLALPFLLYWLLSFLRNLKL